MNVTKKKENESEWRIRVAIGETFDSVERKSLRPMSIAFILRSNWENEYFFFTIFWYANRADGPVRDWFMGCNFNGNKNIQTYE